MKKISEKVAPYLGIFGDKQFRIRTKPEETIVLFGFWRSGTTWLQETLSAELNARTVFEPLTRHVPQASFLLRHIEGIKGKHSIPYIRPGANIDKKTRNFLYKVIKGDVSNIWTKRVAGIDTVFSERVVVKTIYGSLLAAYLKAE